MIDKPRFPVRFDGDAFREDMARATEAGRRAAEIARRAYETSGVRVSDLRPCARKYATAPSYPGV